MFLSVNLVYAQYFEGAALHCFQLSVSSPSRIRGKSSPESSDATPSKRPRTDFCMTDQGFGPYSPPAVGHHASRVGASVANRLKKSLATTGLGHVQNGAAAGPENVENGHSAVSVGEPTPVGSPVELSEIEKEIVRLIGQHLKTLGMT